MTKYAVFEDGFPVAFYDEDLHGPLRLVTYSNDGEVIEDEPNPNSLIPAEAVPITHEQWTEFLQHQGFRKWDGKKIVPHLPPNLPPDVN